MTQVDPDAGDSPAVESDAVVETISVAALADTVWQALTEPEALARWFADAGASLDLRPGGAATFSWSQYGTFDARVGEVDPPRVFAFSWWPRGSPERGNATTARIVLDAGPSSTAVTVTESGFDELDLDPDGRAAQRAEAAQGWREVLAALETYLRAPR